MRSAALSALDGGAHDRLRDRQHEPKVPGRVPTRVVLACPRDMDPGRPLAQLQDLIETGLE